MNDDRFFANWFWRELEEGLIHIRDKLQFELKSEFSGDLSERKNKYTQELFIFIPESLQINAETYPKERFYLDETNQIRFKTPQMTFKDLKNRLNPLSPLSRLIDLIQEKDGLTEELIHELKMLGNIFRSTLRTRVKQLIEELDMLPTKELSLSFYQKVDSLLEDVNEVSDQLKEFSIKYDGNDKKVKEAFLFVEEFFTITIESYFTTFLDIFRKGKFKPSETVDKKISGLILTKGQFSFKEEELLMHVSSLNKYMMEALYLKYTRIEVKKRHNAVIGMAAAGTAMLVYMLLFAWKATDFAITSYPFVFFAVLLYILKDRVKEGLKELYWKNFSTFFPDYSTRLLSPGDKTIGTLNETVGFISDIPKDIGSLREEVQHEEEWDFSENCLYYKKELILDSHALQRGSRRQEINTLFRFNIIKFLEKASDSIQMRLKLNPKTLKISEKKLPKSYPLTLFLRSQYRSAKEIKKFRVLINKSGIERVFYLGLIREFDT